MSVSVSCSLAYVEQGRSTCNFSRSLSVELFASQRVSVGAPNRRELCHSLASSLAIASQRVSVGAPNRREL